MGASCHPCLRINEDAIQYNYILNAKLQALYPLRALSYHVTPCQTLPNGILPNYFTVSGVRQLGRPSG